MSQFVRQNNLFAAEDYLKVYRAFSEVNFRSYDFDTIKASLIEYIQTHFPEDFNDYVESSEFIAIIELLAYLGQSLSFRVDINSRENFLDTAERKESVIRLARMLNYQPKRIIPASGVMKLSAIRTDEPLTDSSGLTLTNKTVFWNDANNEDSFEQFVLIMNSAMTSSNRFGRPFKRGTIGTVSTELYQMNNVPGIEVAYKFNATVNGAGLPFEVTNVNFNDNEFFYEPNPDPANTFNVIYRNDGQGLESTNTGFFLFFKQGSLNFEDKNLEFPVENRVVEINHENINETDVFVQSIDETGNVLNHWSKVPALSGNNIIFNSVNVGERNIFTVLPDTDDTVNLRFADGNFGNIPTGILRTWYRTSSPDRVIVRPEDVRSQEITIPYYSRNGQQFNLTLTFELEYTVSNSAPAENDTDIKERATQVYYTQNRMVNAEDYNVFPLTQGASIVKIRSVNRTYAGHSRFIDINDPTGQHNDVIVFGEDGVIYQDDEPTLKEILLPDNAITTQIITIDIQDCIQDSSGLINFFYDTVRDSYLASDPQEFSFDGLDIFWATRPESGNSNTGFFGGAAPSFVPPVNVVTGAAPRQYIRTGSVLKFRNPNDPTDIQYSTVLSVDGNGTPFDTSDLLELGAIELSNSIPHGWQLIEAIVGMRTTFTASEIADIFAELVLFNPVGLSYNPLSDSWNIITGDNIDVLNPYSLANAGDDTSNNLDASWVLRLEYLPSDGVSTPKYIIYSRGLRYVFESFEEVRFYDNPELRTVDVQTGRAVRDELVLLDCNFKPEVTETLIYDSTIVIDGDPGAWLIQGTELIYPSNTIILRERGISLDDLTITYYDDDTGLDHVLDGALYLGAAGILDISPDLSGLSITEADGDVITISYADDLELLDSEIAFNISDIFVYEDGYSDPRKVEIVPVDTDGDGIPDNPLAFQSFINETNDCVFFERYTDFDDYEYFRPWVTGWNDIRGLGNTSGDLIGAITDTGGINSLNTTEYDLILVDDQDQLDYIMNSTDGLNASPEFDTVILPAATTIPRLNYVGKVIYNFDNGLFYRIVYEDGTAPGFNSENVLLDTVVDADNYRKYIGRSFNQNTNADDRGLFFKWKHYAPRDNRIDPSISNIIDMFVLTDAYYQQILSWKNNQQAVGLFPEPPTTEELRLQFSNLNTFKMLSDQIVFRPAMFKVLFGEQAAPELRAKFKVVKVPSTLVSDNEIKTRVIEAIDEYFSLDNFDFGEGFFYTELSAYIHQQLATIIGSVVIVPEKAESQFGNLFQVKGEPHELFISTATASNIEIVKGLTATNMRLDG